MVEFNDRVPPPLFKGMSELDRSKFHETLQLVVAEIETPQLLTQITKKALSSDLLQMPKISRIVNIEDKRGILLSPTIKDPTTAKSQLSEQTAEILDAAKVTYKPYSLELNYDYWTADEILRSILPTPDDEVPTGFSIVGHIAHLNLRDHFLPYKHLIGQVILDKNSHAIKTVVNKLDTINTVFRTFDMEVIAGENNFNVEQVESGCRFQFDFRQVYWNSRLHTEHDRLVKQFGHHIAIADPFAGVGPFAIPAAKQENLVFANDLNPHGAECMKKNAKLNKINEGLIRIYNEDAREFIKQSISRLHEYRVSSPNVELPPQKIKTPNQKSELKKRYLQTPEYFSHYVMNLPATAIEFLDAFRGLYTKQTFSEKPPAPIVHVHCFHKFEPNTEPTKEEVRSALAKRVSTAMQFEIDESILNIHDVRRVAPSKDMYCVEFPVPEQVLYA